MRDSAATPGRSRQVATSEQNARSSGVTMRDGKPLQDNDKRRHECFELDGARVHRNPNMSQESREALREVIAAARERIAKGVCSECGHIWGTHSTGGCVARVPRGDRCGCQIAPVVESGTVDA